MSEEEQSTSDEPSSGETSSEESPTADGAAAEGAPADEPATSPQEIVEEICGKVPIKHSKELAGYVRELATVIPALQRMGVEQTL